MAEQGAEGPTKELDRLRELVKLGRLALEGGALPELFAAACRALRRTLRVERCGVFELVDEGRKLVLRVGEGWEEGQLGALSLPGSLVASADGATLLGDPLSASVGAPEVMLALGGVRGAVAPISVGAERHGVLCGLTPALDRVFDAEELQVLEAIAQLLGTAVARKGTEDSLRASDQRMALAQKIAHLGSYDWDIRTDTNVWSDELYRIYGVDPQSFNASYERFLSFVAPADRAKVIAVHQRAYRDGAPYQMEEHIIRPDGERRVLATNGIVLTEEGRPTRMVGVCMDVTEQKRRGEALEKSLARSRGLMESALHGILVLRSGRVDEVNAAGEALFGATPGGLHGVAQDRLFPEGLPEGGLVFDVAARQVEGSPLSIDIEVGHFWVAEEEFVAVYALPTQARREAEQRRAGNGQEALAGGVDGAH